ncbi:glycosyltransferase, partial [Mycobacterium sp. ITM-2017-0098]
LRDVPMSAPDTGKLTLEALQYNDLRVVLTEELGDVDTVGDIGGHALRTAPMSRFRRITATVSVGEA